MPPATTASADVQTGPPPETSQRTDVATQSAPPMLRRVDASGAVQVPSPLELIQFAVERGVAAEQIKELVALQEHMEDRAAAREFNHALAAFKHECPAIVKNRVVEIETNAGGKFGYSYAELDEIVRVVDPILFRHGLSYTWDSRIEGALLTCDCILRHENGHSVKASFTLPIESKNPGMSLQQKAGGALTFAQRRSLCSVLGIVTTESEQPKEEVDPSTITEDQATFILDKIAELRINTDRLCKHLKIGRVEDMRAADYKKAMGIIAARERDLEKKKEPAQ